MYGNNRKPGFYEGNTSRVAGTIWLGYPEATWFRTAKVKGDSPDDKPLPLGSIVKEEFADGTFVPAKESDIAAAATGQVDQARLLVGAKKFPDLTDEQKVHLREQLEVWGFALEVVQQS